MAAIVGKRVETRPSQVGGGAVPATTKARPSFFFMVSAKGWDYDAGSGHWLPNIKRHYIDPGANGITRDMNPAQAYTEREQRGYTVIRPDDARLGDYRFYVQKLPYAGNGVFCLSIFESAEVMPDGEVFIARDDDAWRAFRVFLVTSGIVPPLDPRRKRVLLGTKTKTLQRKETLAANALEGSAAHRRLGEFRALYDAAALAGPPTNKPPKPAPKPKATRKPRRAKTAHPTPEVTL
jgi:hypothetical protein